MSDYSSIQITQAEIDSDKWKLTLYKKLNERTPYEKGDQLTICQVTGRIVGIGYDETDYYLSLHELYSSDGVHVLSEDLNKEIPPEMFQRVQKILMINQKEKGLSVNRIVAFMEGERLLPAHKNTQLHRLLRKSLISVLDTFQKNHKDGLNNPDFRRVLVDIVKWSWNHLDQWLKESDPEVEMPRVIWYGDTKKSQLYFLFYLMTIGCDVLLFHPEGKDEFAALDPDQAISKLVHYPTKGEIAPFPTEKPARQSTVAYRATQELNDVLFHDGSQLYKPWQFRDSLPTSVTLRTTYDELFLISKEKAFVRPNFHPTRKQVEIPSIFAKIMGVSANKKEYWSRLHSLVDDKNGMLIQHFPFTKEVKANHTFHYQHAMGKDGTLDLDKIITGNWWQYKHLPDGVQRAIAHVISNMCANPRLLPLNHESTEDVRLYLFTQATDLSLEDLKIIQKFDYSQDVPKLVLFNNEMNGMLSRSDAARLLFFNELGVDITVYNPPGHNCIEQYIESSVFDTHWLEEMSFELEFKEPSFVKRFFRTLKSQI
jgi:Putative component of 'biosynthetic module'